MVHHKTSAQARFPQSEHGLCVEISEDGSRVVMALDRDHARELAAIISTLAVSGGGHDVWLEVAWRTADDTWLGAMLRLMACSQNLRPPNHGPEQRS